MSNSISEIQEVTKEVGKSLNDFIVQARQPTAAGTEDAPALHLAYRFVGLARFRTHGVAPPEGMAYLFLFLNQLVYQETAILFPAECGLPNKSLQQIQTFVNDDISAISDIKFGKDSLSKSTKSNNKV